MVKTIMRAALIIVIIAGVDEISGKLTDIANAIHQAAQPPLSKELCK